MGKPTGFLEFTRELPTKRSVEERVGDYKEFVNRYSDEKLNQQSGRCMDCGVPFCHNGCPLGNVIPEFNDAVYRKEWKEAYDILSSTNNFPEFTGRICPAPCETACVLGINQPAIAIEEIEKHIIEIAFDKGFVKAKKINKRTGKKVAVVGSGPAGLAAATQLNYAGHTVTVFERDDQPGGLLRYGIPDFKLEKWVIDRRVKLMEEEGVTFKCNANVGVNVSVNDLLREYHAIVLAGGSTVPRDLNVPGRELKGVYFAMQFLKQQNKRNAGLDPLANAAIESNILTEEVFATDKNVVVIGGGDTGSDCVGTSNRHKASAVTQFELMPMPPKERTNFIVEKAVELGVARLCPVQTDFTNSDRLNRDRMQANAREAAEQCGATLVPPVEDLRPLERVLADWPEGRRILWCNEAQAGVATALAGLEGGPWAILIGPEGGFSERERARLAGLPQVVQASLGPRILRAETAAVAALVLWQAAMGDWR